MAQETAPLSPEAAIHFDALQLHQRKLSAASDHDAAQKAFTSGWKGIFGEVAQNVAQRNPMGVIKISLAVYAFLLAAAEAIEKEREYKKLEKEGGQNAPPPQSDNQDAFDNAVNARVSMADTAGTPAAAPQQEARTRRQGGMQLVTH